MAGRWSVKERTKSDELLLQRCVKHGADCQDSEENCLTFTALKEFLDATSLQVFFSFSSLLSCSPSPSYLSSLYFTSASLTLPFSCFSFHLYSIPFIPSAFSPGLSSFAQHSSLLLVVTSSLLTRPLGVYTH